MTEDSEQFKFQKLEKQVNGITNMDLILTNILKFTVAFRL